MEKVNIKEKIDFLRKSLYENQSANLHIILLGKSAKIINDMKAKYLEGVNNELHDTLESILNDFGDMLTQSQSEEYQ